jgi:hypothetical protein
VPPTSSELAPGTINASDRRQESNVQNHPTTSAPVEALETDAVEAPRQPWQAEVGELLSAAAALCVEHDVDVDHFMRGAWSSYLEARPGMREHLEEMQLRDQLEEIRKAGRIGQA